MPLLNDTELYRALLAISIGAFLMASWSVMKVHITDHPIFKKVRTARNMLVLTYIAIISYNVTELFFNFSKRLLATLFITSGMFESLFMISFLITLINPALLKWKWIYQHITLIMVLFICNLFTGFYAPVHFNSSFYVTMGVYALQIGWYAFYFIKVYRQTTQSLTEYYEEDEEIHIKWIRNSFIGLFSISIMTVLTIPSNFAYYNFYIICYCIAYSYIAVGFINRYYKYSKILPAVVEMTQKAEKKKSRQATNNIPAQPIYYDKSRLAISLDLWISEKGYLVPNVPMEKILKILDTTGPILHSFMQEIYGMDFRNWRNELRLEYAYNLLTQHLEDSVEIVAKQVGFSDMNYFIHSFVRKYDIHPKTLLNKTEVSSTE